MFLCISLPKQQRQDKHITILADMKVGIGYDKSSRLIISLLFIYGITIFFGVPSGFMAQFFVSRSFGDTYWYLMTAEVIGFLGMLLGGVLLSIWGGFKSRAKTLLIGLTIFGVLGASIGLAQSFIFYLILMFIYGIALTMVSTVSTTMLQENSEPSMLGRVFGLLSGRYSGFLLLGMAVFGPLADVISLLAIMFFANIALIGTAVIVYACRLLGGAKS